MSVRVKTELEFLRDRESIRIREINTLKDHVRELEGDIVSLLKASPGSWQESSEQYNYAERLVDDLELKYSKQLKDKGQ